MALSPQFTEYLHDVFSEFPPDKIRPMFGGVGIFREGLMFALGTSEERIALKADEQTIPDFQAEGTSQWNPNSQAKEPPKQGYWYVPEHLLEDPDEFSRWATKAFGVAMRADAKKPPKQRKFNPD